MGDLTERLRHRHPAAERRADGVRRLQPTNPPKKIEMVEYDSQGSADQAVRWSPRRSSRTRSSGCIGPTFSGESKAADAVLEQAKIPNISSSARTPGCQERLEFLPPRGRAGLRAGPRIADFLISAKSPKKAFVISDDQEYSVGGRWR